MVQCNDLGRWVPGGYAVIGFDGVRLAVMVSPSLTSVRVNKYDLDQQAIMRLLTTLEEPAAILPPTRVEVELRVRQST